MAESSSSNSPKYPNLNLVLVGRTGNGKSSTANSIVGRKAFHAMPRAGGVTTHCQVETIKYENGQTINVIDMAGFFDFSSQSDFIGDEIIKCVEMVTDGIHAFLLVFSIRTRFSKEEEAVINNLRMLFGDKILRYIIVVFTGGDDLEETGTTLEDYMGTGCPPPLKRIIRETGNAPVVFNNRTKDANEKKAQLQHLITTVEAATTRNRGRPFMDALIDLQVQNLITTVETATTRNRGRPFTNELIELQVRAIELRVKADKDAKELKKYTREMVEQENMAESSSSTSPKYPNLNLVLVGRTGNGKSSTANSIVGRKAFHAVARAGGVTTLCQVETNKLENGQTINVIDTPGFFDFSSQSDFIGDEVIKCVEMVTDGIHAFLLVFSMRTRFSQEEEAVINNLRMLFGDKIVRYMVVVFTGGDDLENDGITLEKYMGTGCPRPLKRIIRETGNAPVVFNNRTKDANEKKAQLQHLITTVENATTRNRGRPFMDELIDLQARVTDLRNKAEKDAKYALQLEENMKKLMAEAEVRLNSQILKLKKQLEEAQAIRKVAQEERDALERRLEEAEERARGFQKQSESSCSIL